MTPSPVDLLSRPLFHPQIKNLKEAETYVFRVRAQNQAGVGKTSEATEPVSAVTKPGKDGPLRRAASLS